MTQRSKQATGGNARTNAGRKRAHSQEDPRVGGKAQAARVPSPGAGGSHSGDEPQDMGSVSLSPNQDPQDMGSATGTTLVPAAELSAYKGYPLKDVGRDAKGMVIPHRRDESIAKRIAIWVAGGADVNYIAVKLNLRPGLLKREYTKELLLGTEQVHQEVHEHLLQRVKKSDRVAIFYAKAKMGYRDGDSRPAEQGILDIHIHT